MEVICASQPFSYGPPLCSELFMARAEWKINTSSQTSKADSFPTGWGDQSTCANPTACPYKLLPRVGPSASLGQSLIRKVLEHMILSSTHHHESTALHPSLIRKDFRLSGVTVGGKNPARTNGYISWLKRTIYSGKWTTSLMWALNQAASWKHMFRATRGMWVQLKYLSSFSFFRESQSLTTYICLAFSETHDEVFAWAVWSLNCIGSIPGAGGVMKKNFFGKKNLVCYSFLMVSMPSFHSLSNLKHVGLVL